MFALLARMRTLLQGVNIRDIDIIIQFRRAVTGSITPKYCHPFPITSEQEELDSLDVITNCALAHNGVIFEYASYGGQWDSASCPAGKNDINDAQEFIKDYLVGMGESIWNPCVQALIEAHTDSKFALLSSRGIAYIGGFIKEKGCFYSNGDYKIGKKIPTWAYRNAEEDKWDSAGFQEAQRKAFPPSGTPYTSYTGKGTLCDFCQIYSVPVYHIESADSVVCGQCYEQLMGEQPRAEERLV